MLLVVCGFLVNDGFNVVIEEKSYLQSESVLIE